MKQISVAGFFLAALLCVPAARGQQSPGDQGGNVPATPDQPLPANPATSSGGTSNGGAAPAGRSILGSDLTDTTQGTDQTESLPLSGAEQLAIPGGQARNIFDASVLFSGSGDSGVINTQGSPIWGASELLGGGLSVDRTWKADHFSLSYSGGAELFQPTALYPTTTFHSLSLAQSFGWKRVTLRLLDQFSYSPNTPFGGAGIGGPGLLAETGGGGGTLNPTFASNDTILTGGSRILNNSAVAEIQYNLSRRSSFTLTGSDVVLDYIGGGFISDHAYVVSGGYNYMITTKDTLAVTYALTETHYTGTTEMLDFQQVNFACGHVLSGRMVFQISAGPEFIVAHGYTPSVPNELTWSLSTGVQYRLRRSSLGASYSRGANPGSGVFAGSTTQDLGGSASHQFSRFLIGVVNAGYSFNKNLANVPGVSNEYRNWFVGGSIGRELGRHAHISFNYGVLQQPSSGICPVTSCYTNRVVQTIGAALDVHVRPVNSTE
jgi:hypothetical protein